MLNISQIRNIASKAYALEGRVVYSTACAKPTIMDGFIEQLINPKIVKKCVNKLRKQAVPEKEFVEALFKAKAEQEGLSVFVLGRRAGESKVAYQLRLNAAQDADVFISSRIKSETSGFDKIKNLISKMQNVEGPLDAAAQKKYEASQEMLTHFLAEKPLSQKYKELLGDLLGIRFLENKATVKGKDVTDVIVNNMSSLHTENKISLRRVENYKGEGIKPYTTAERSAAIGDLRYVDDKGELKKVLFVQDLKASGYTRINSDVKINGVNGEIQIGGKHTCPLGDSEHILYDTRSKKRLVTDGYTREERLLAKEVVKEYKKVLNNEKLNGVYGEYLREIWQTARTAEIAGVKPIYKQAPAGISSVLSIDNILSLKH